MRYRVLGLLAVGMLAACSSGSQSDRAQVAASQDNAAALDAAASAQVRAVLGRDTNASFASLPDRGDLIAYDRTRKSHKAGAFTFHPVSLSEAHALDAIGPGRELVVTAPNGESIRLSYDSHVEHEDGNWTWIGRAAGDPDGAATASITFGERAAFGEIPYGNHAALRLSIAGGKAWLVETDQRLAVFSGDVDPQLRVDDTPLLRDASGQPIREDHRKTAASAASATTAAVAPPIVDVVLGYTTGFAARLGGRSQATTRLAYMVDRGNLALRNSQVPGRLRLVQALQVDYPDDTPNLSALQQLTGVTCLEPGCSPTTIPASLTPLHDARDAYGADLVSLVRVFNDPENEGCGAAWLIGGGRVAITSQDAMAGMSVVGDSSGTLYPDNGLSCRDENLVHELAHNMGSAHDRDTAAGANHVLEDAEYGRYDYSFGHVSANPGFATIMADAATGKKVEVIFSNPRLRTCYNLSYYCGVADVADNARSLTETMPIIATFRASKHKRRAPHDLNNDGRSDLLWRNDKVVRPDVRWWFMDGATPAARYYTTQGEFWRVEATADLDGDGRADVLWRRANDQKLLLLRSCGNGFCYLGANESALDYIATPGTGWALAGVGDVDGDGRADLLWHYGTYMAGNFQYWLMDGTTILRKVSLTMPAGYKVVTAEDFNADGKLDILWRNGTTNSYRMWTSGATGFTGKSFDGPGTAWQLVGAGEVNNDGKADLVWWLPQQVGANFRYWIMDGATKVSQKSYTQTSTYKVVAMGDYDGNGMLDVVWRFSNSTDIRMWLNIGGTLTPVLIATGLTQNFYPVPVIGP